MSSRLIQSSTICPYVDFLFLDIIGKVRNREIPACRPKLFNDVGDLSPSVSKLMQLCWSDAEFSRPTFGNIRTYIKKNIKGTYVDFLHDSNV